MVFGPGSKDHKSMNSLLIPLFNPWWSRIQPLVNLFALQEDTIIEEEGEEDQASCEGSADDTPRQTEGKKANRRRAKKGSKEPEAKSRDDPKKSNDRELIGNQ